MSIEELVNRPPPTELPAPRSRGRLRRAAGITQHELARALNVSRTTIANWERGVKEPTGENREKYAEFFCHLRKRAEARKDTQ
jgi:DNA-binding XRE family transcriptional regulator